MMTWAEDRATVGTDLSADPGAKTEGRAEDRLPCSARSSRPPSGLASGDKSLAANAASQCSATPQKWPEFPEKCGHIFRNAQTVVVRDHDP